MLSGYVSEGQRSTGGVFRETDGEELDFVAKGRTSVSGENGAPSSVFVQDIGNVSLKT